MIPCFPFHQKAWGMRAGRLLFGITIHTCIRAPATLTTHANAAVDNEIRVGILIQGFIRGGGGGVGSPGIPTLP